MEIETLTAKIAECILDGKIPARDVWLDLIAMLSFLTNTEREILENKIVEKINEVIKERIACNPSEKTIENILQTLNKLTQVVSEKIRKHIDNTIAELQEDLIRKTTSDVADIFIKCDIHALEDYNELLEKIAQCVLEKQEDLVLIFLKNRGFQKFKFLLSSIFKIDPEKVEEDLVRKVLSDVFRKLALSHFEECITEKSRARFGKLNEVDCKLCYDHVYSTFKKYLEDVYEVNYHLADSLAKDILSEIYERVCRSKLTCSRSETDLRQANIVYADESSIDEKKASCVHFLEICDPTIIDTLKKCGIDVSNVSEEDYYDVLDKLGKCINSREEFRDRILSRFSDWITVLSSIFNKNEVDVKRDLVFRSFRNIISSLAIEDFEGCIRKKRGSRLGKITRKDCELCLDHVVSEFSKFLADRFGLERQETKKFSEDVLSPFFSQCIEEADKYIQTQHVMLSSSRSEIFEDSYVDVREAHSLSRHSKTEDSTLKIVLMLFMITLVLFLLTLLT